MNEQSWKRLRKEVKKMFPDCRVTNPSSPYKEFIHVGNLKVGYPMKPFSKEQLEFLKDFDIEWESGAPTEGRFVDNSFYGITIWGIK